MRKMMMLMIALATMVNTTNAAFTENKAADNNHHKGSFTDRQKVAEFLVNLNRKDYEQLTGRHLTLLERLAFSIAQRQLKKQLKKVQEDTGEKTIGFFTGFFFWLPGLLLVYLLSKNVTIRKWALIGAIAVSIVILLLLLFIASVKLR